MSLFQYYADGKLHRMNVQTSERLAAAKPKKTGKGARDQAAMAAMVRRVQNAIHAQSTRLPRSSTVWPRVLCALRPRRPTPRP
jgi:hypothetical protein